MKGLLFAVIKYKKNKYISISVNLPMLKCKKQSMSIGGIRVSRTKQIYGNMMSAATEQKAVSKRKKLMKKFGNDAKTHYHLGTKKNASLYDFIGIRDVVIEDESQDIGALTESLKSEDKPSIFDEKSVIVGNIRMGFGHYRISMAIASCANHLGYTPYWLDLNSYKQTTGGQVINHLNDLYSLGSRLSDKYSVFNRFYWEPLNSEGFKKLTYNAMDQEMTKLMTPIYEDIPSDIPYVATHVWPAQAAVHAGLSNVVNVIPDNWPMALHLAEGAIQTVQTPSSYFGYRTLKGMNKDKVNKPIPGSHIVNVGHYVDHELVVNIDEDCNARINRTRTDKPMRYLLTVGGAGAQKELFKGIINHLIPSIKKEKATLMINVGDHKNVWDDLAKELPELNAMTTKHFDDWTETCYFSEQALSEDMYGIHAFYHKDIFQAVYSTNLLMRASDVLVTKPSELSFYPIPKLIIKRVGGHEAYGAIRGSEVGDSTLECETLPLTLQMVDLLLEDNDILVEMCHNIKKAHSIGIYNGGYKAVELAVRS